nr:hypothetical protein BaRGS_013603 [Batillaria attramentaria]
MPHYHCVAIGCQNGSRKSDKLEKFPETVLPNGGLFASPALESTRLFVTGNSGGISWEYTGTLGPSEWHTVYPDCGGRMQSPINIMENQVLYDPSMEVFDIRQYGTCTDSEVKYSGTPIGISGGSLPDDYVLDQFHFHWGSNNDKGSEHTIDFKAAPLELAVFRTLKTQRANETQEVPIVNDFRPLQELHERRVYSNDIKTVDNLVAVVIEQAVKNACQDLQTGDRFLSNHAPVRIPFRLHLEYEKSNLTRFNAGFKMLFTVLPESQEPESLGNDASNSAMRLEDLSENYYLVELVLRNCKLDAVAGFLSLLSSEVSAFNICLITVDRFLVLRFPFSRVRFGRYSATAACVIAWIIGLCLASVPLLPVTSDWEFYSQTGICIPLPINRASFKGGLYSFNVMIVLNFVLFLLIAVGQAVIFYAIRSNSMTTAKKSSSRDAAIARRLTTIVLSDFLCWFPICVLGLMAANGTTVSTDVNVGMAIFVLPFNSALNPFLYTFNILMEKRRRAEEAKLMKRLEMKMATVTAELDVKSNAPHKLTKASAIGQIKTWLEDKTFTLADLTSQLELWDASNQDESN